MQRRQFLLFTTFAVGIAGCIDSEDGSDETDDGGEDDPNGTDDGSSGNGSGRQLQILLEVLDERPDEGTILSRDHSKIADLEVFQDIYDEIDWMDEESEDGLEAIDGTIALDFSHISVESSKWEAAIEVFESTETHIPEQHDSGALLTYGDVVLHVTYNIDRLE